MKRIDWQTQEPGHVDVDLVHLSGPITVGDSVHTLQMVDVATGWSERVAVMGRGYRRMQAGVEHILRRFPFEVKEVHPDNGSEFFNQHLVRFWRDKVVGVHLSRSRPSQKNDNRIVEQKNDTLVRQYFREMRLDTAEELKQINALYEQMWLYYNFFQPVLHLREKTVVEDRVRRTWDQVQTPFERRKAPDGLNPEQQQRLQVLYEQTNPRQLREEIYRQ